MCYLPLILQTVAWHDPGQYAWQNNAHGERMLANQRQAIDARMKQFQGAGTVRSVAPGTTFTLADHPEHDRDDAEKRNFLITTATHRARNNLGAAIPGSDAPQEVPLGDNDPTVNRKKSPKSKSPEAEEGSAKDNDSDVFYRVELTANRSCVATNRVSSRPLFR